MFYFILYYYFIVLSLRLPISLLASFYFSTATIFFFPSSTNASFPYSFSKSTSIFINNLEIYDHPVKMSNTSRRLDTKLIDFLTSMAQKPSLPPATRHQATYIIASYHKHRNVYRLMAHISALSNGEMVINISHGVKSMAEDKDSPVYHLGTYLQDLMADLRISPTIPDFEGHPIELYSVLDSVTRSLISGEQEFELHRALLSMEKRANEHLAHLTKKYGYHFIFRVGLQQYYMT